MQRNVRGFLARKRVARMRARESEMERWLRLISANSYRYPPGLRSEQHTHSVASEQTSVVNVYGPEAEFASVVLQVVKLSFCCCWLILEVPRNLSAGFWQCGGL
jgi:hypothetical protein